MSKSKVKSKTKTNTKSKSKRICMFKNKYKCSNRTECQESQGSGRIKSIIAASKSYNDGLHVELEKELERNPKLKKHYHKDCVSTYTTASNTNLKRYQEDKRTEQVQPKRLRTSASMFDILTQCIYCGLLCFLKEEWEKIDPKHPDRWDPAYICRSVVSAVDGKPYKDRLLEKCDERNDEWAEEVRARIIAIISDLHAADMRYHAECVQRFFANRAHPKANFVTPSETGGVKDGGLEHTLKVLVKDKSKTWNSIELFKVYKENGGTLETRKYLIQQVQKHFDGELVVLNCPGYASLLTFKKSKNSYLKLIKDDEDDNLDTCISVVAKKIVEEIAEIVLDKSRYILDISKADLQACVSETFLKLLSQVSPKLDRSCLPSLTVGNIVTGIVKGASTELQRALGVLLRDSKNTLGYMGDYGITCTYDEVLLFKKSAAVAALNNPSDHGVDKAEDGMMQIVVDNYDASISSPNGLLSTHSLGGIIIQPKCTKVTSEDDNSIKRLKYTQRSHDIPDEPLVEFTSQKKPEMPEVPTKQKLTDSDAMSLQVSVQRAKDLDFQFLNDVITKNDCPEYNGFNTRVCREQGHTIAKKSNIIYTPLTDNTPSDPTTMKTAMLKGKKDTTAAGQKFTMFNADLQLYKTAVHILWQCPTEFNDFYVRLGGMHMLMSYVGAIGTLMANSGIVDILSSAFGGVLKMLTGKKFPENVRALRILVEELLRPVIVKTSPKNMDELMEVLQEASTKRRTAKLWVDCLIKPVLIMMRYIRAERESDWLLHLHSVKEMSPLFFASGHCNYARYGQYNHRCMEALPEDVRKRFLNGEHTVHLSEGLFNGMWGDMGIECTLMRYGHGPGGLTGITLQPQTVKTWRYSLHACNRVVSSLDTMRENEKVPKCEHKEEMASRIKSDAKDREAIRKKLAVCIDPILSDEYSDSLVNIATGQVIVDPVINVDKALDIGEEQMNSFEESWPKGFHDPIQKKVKTMALTKKHVKVGEKAIFDTETIYAKAMALQHTSESLNTKKLLSYELAPYPTSIFDESGLREAKGKSALMNALKVEASGRNVVVEAIFIDGCAFLWTVPWPKKGKVQDFLKACHLSLCQYLKEGQVYLIFDR